jgi:hypothetical protein
MRQLHHNISQYNNKNKLEAWGLKHQTTESLQQQKNIVKLNNGKNWTKWYLAELSSFTNLKIAEIRPFGDDSPYISHHSSEGTERTLQFIHML